MTWYRSENNTLTQDITEAKLSICNMIGGCGCMTYSIENQDKTAMKCGKCGNTK